MLKGEPSSSTGNSGASYAPMWNPLFSNLNPPPAPPLQMHWGS